MFLENNERNLYSKNHVYYAIFSRMIHEDKFYAYVVEKSKVNIPGEILGTSLIGWFMKHALYAEHAYICLLTVEFNS